MPNKNQSFLIASFFLSYSLLFAEDFLISESQAKPDLQQINTASYGIGLQIARGLKEQDLAIDINQMIKGIKDHFNEKKPKFTDKMIQKSLAYLQDYAEKMKEKSSQENHKKGLNFLVINQKDKAVVKSKSGMQYKILKKGNGPIPKKTSKVLVHYQGFFTDNKEFESTYKLRQPAEFMVSSGIDGWIEALTQMPEGSKWEVVLPHHLAYGSRGRPGIPPYSVLKFTLELVKIVQL